MHPSRTVNPSTGMWRQPYLPAAETTACSGLQGQASRLPLQFAACKLTQAFSTSYGDYCGMIGQPIMPAAGGLFCTSHLHLSCIPFIEINICI